jgi:hypothetical protein
LKRKHRKTRVTPGTAFIATNRFKVLTLRLETIAACSIVSCRGNSQGGAGSAGAPAVAWSVERSVVVSVLSPRRLLVPFVGLMFIARILVAHFNEQCKHANET